jgi:F-type H+-transporting ATPase subunit delta
VAELTTLARPYAKAAFEHAIQHKQLPEWSALLQFVGLLVANPLIKQRLKHPHFSKNEHQEMMLTLCSDIKNKNILNFIQLLAQNNRLMVLPEIERLFNFLRSEFEKTIKAVITSATELNDIHLKQIKEKLGAKLGRQVEIIVKINTDLLGGFIIRAEDLVIDSSVRGQLTKLSKTLNT